MGGKGKVIGVGGWVGTAVNVAVAEGEPITAGVGEDGRVDALAEAVGTAVYVAVALTTGTAVASGSSGAQPAANSRSKIISRIL
jgi:hypothetical protein